MSAPCEELLLDSGEIATVFDDIDEEEGDEECPIGLLRMHADGRFEVVD